MAYVACLSLGCAGTDELGARVERRPREASAAEDAKGAAFAGAEPEHGAGDTTALTGMDLIRAWEALDRLEGEALARAGPNRFEAFLAAHPEILTVQEHPYGPALAWSLQFARQEAALALIHAHRKASGVVPEAGARLWEAAMNGMDETVRVLLEAGADVNAKSYWGTALHAAAKYGHAAIIDRLLAAGADPNVAADDHRFTPLIVAAIEGHTACVERLVAAGADVRATDDDRRTALHWAAFAYRPREIHEYGADGGPHDTYALPAAPPEAARVLLDAGAPLDAADAEGNTALHSAVIFDAPGVVELLVARGAKRTLRNRDGLTALQLARKRNKPHLAKLLQ